MEILNFEIDQISALQKGKDRIMNSNKNVGPFLEGKHLNSALGFAKVIFFDQIFVGLIMIMSFLIILPT